MASLAEHAPSPPPAKEMAWIPPGRFSMGSEDFYPEERPVHQVSVDGFWMDEHPVTAAEFRRFVRETRYVTVAERPLDPEQYPDADPDLLVPGSLVFRRSRRARRPQRLPQLVGVRARRPLAPAWRERHDDQRTRPPPGRARGSRGRRGVRSVGRQGAADRGRVGASPRAADWTARPSPGATSTSRTARRWRTRGRASSRGRT